MNCRACESAGSARSSVNPHWAWPNGHTSAAISTAQQAPHSHGDPVTHRTSRRQAGLDAARRCLIREPSIASSAGTRTTVAVAASSTTAIPATAIDRSHGNGNTHSAENASATTPAETSTLRPAVRAALTAASGTASPRAPSSRKRVTTSRA